MQGKGLLFFIIGAVTCFVCIQAHVGNAKEEEDEYVGEEYADAGGRYPTYDQTDTYDIDDKEISDTDEIDVFADSQETKKQAKVHKYGGVVMYGDAGIDYRKLYGAENQRRTESRRRKTWKK